MATSCCQRPSSNPAPLHCLYSHPLEWTIYLSNLKRKIVLRRLPDRIHGRWYGLGTDQDSSAFWIYCKLRDLAQFTHSVYSVSILDLPGCTTCL